MALGRVGVMSVELVSQKLVEALGNITAVARSLGVYRGAVYDYIEQHPELKKVWHDARESMVDAAESMLHRNILEGKEKSVFFTLKTLGRNRGYVEADVKKLEEIAEKVDKLAGLAEIGMGLEHLLAAAQIETPAPDEIASEPQPNTGGDSWAKLLEEAG